MSCVKFALLIFLLICLAPLVMEWRLGKCQGMVAYRQIRDDPNHTRYIQNTFDDVDPILVYGDVQF